MKTLLSLATLITAANILLASAVCPDECNCTTTDQIIRIFCQGPNTPDITNQLDSLLQAIRKPNLVTSVDIDSTSITSLPPTICSFVNLKKLRFYNNRYLTRFPDKCFSKLPKLVELQADNNGLTALQDGVFNGALSLKTISLIHNGINAIGDYVFSNESETPNLENVELSTNQLTSVDVWPFSRGIATNKTFAVDLGSNAISNLTNRIGYRFVCKHPLSFSINFANNPISRLSIITRVFDTNIAEIYMCLFAQGESQSKIVLDGIDIICDCNEFEVMRLLRLGAEPVAWPVFCSEPRHLAGQQAVRIDLKEFYCEEPVMCPRGCTCVNRPANATLHVYCGATNLTEIPTELPSLPKSYYKYKLDFYENPMLSRLSAQHYYNQSYGLDVSNSRLTEIDDHAWIQLSTMEFVNLRGNRLRTVSKSVQTLNLSTLTIDLSNNLWDCTCENRWLKGWLQTVKNRLVNSKEIMCDSPSRLRGKNIFYVSDDEFCLDPSTRMAIVVASAAATSSVCIFLFVLVLRRMRFRLYRNYQFHPFDRDECEGEEMLYDVFLCCCSADVDPFGREVRDTLHRHGYRVCFHEDHFLPGQRILDNIILSIVTSKRVLCLVTPQFMNSQYCMYEFDTALIHGVTTRHRNRVIILTLLDNPQQLLSDDNSQETAALRHHLKHYTYIDWRANSWQDRLLYALPVNRIGSRDDDLLPGDGSGCGWRNDVSDDEMLRPVND